MKTLKLAGLFVGNWAQINYNQDMDPAITDFQAYIKKTIEQLKEDLKSIRTGKASPALLESITVETYGGQSRLRLNELSTVVLEGSTTLSITPFDPSTGKDIEKAIQQSPLGLNPQPQGNKILIHLPPLSEEQREKMVKLVAVKVEERKGMIRNERDNSRKKIKLMFEQKTATEDDKFRLEKEIDIQTQQAMGEIQSLKESKEQEIRQV